MSMDDANEMLNGKIKKHARGTSFAAMKKSLDTLSLNVTAKHVFEEQGKSKLEMRERDRVSIIER